jgi:hypothetical protein
MSELNSVQGWAVSIGYPVDTLFAFLQSSSWSVLSHLIESVLTDLEKIILTLYG